MKSVLVIGLGRFGRHLCLKLAQLGNEVMIVDQDEAAVTNLANFVTRQRIQKQPCVTATISANAVCRSTCQMCLKPDCVFFTTSTSIKQNGMASIGVSNRAVNLHAPQIRV